MSTMSQQSNARRRRVRDHNAVWAKDDAWKDTRGGFNPDVFKDLDSGTRQRLRDHQVGPSVIKGDKVNAVTSLNTGAWGDGVHGEAGAINHMYWGGEKGEKRAHNRGYVQQAVWETGLSNIGNKDQLNQFLDRADSVKAEHGDFLKDGWTPEAIMLMREKPQQAPAPAPKAEPVAKEPEPTPDPITESSHLAEAKERAVNFKNPSSGGAFNATSQNPDSFDKRPTKSNLVTDYDFTSGASNLMSNVSSNKPPAGTTPAEADLEPSTSSSSTDNKQPYKKPFTDLVASSAGALMGSFG